MNSNTNNFHFFLRDILKFMYPQCTTTTLSILLHQSRCQSSGKEECHSLVFHTRTAVTSIDTSHRVVAVLMKVTFEVINLRSNKVKYFFLLFLYFRVYFSYEAHALIASTESMVILFFVLSPDTRNHINLHRGEESRWAVNVSEFTARADARTDLL